MLALSLFALLLVCLPGQVSALVVADGSTFNCNTALEDYVIVEGTGRLNALSGCEINGFIDDPGQIPPISGSVIVRGTATAVFHPGSAVLEDLEASGSTSVRILGGSFGNDVEIKGPSVVSIFGGIFGDVIEDPVLGGTLALHGTFTVPDGPLPTNEEVSVEGTLADGSEFFRDFFLDPLVNGIVLINPCGNGILEPGEECEGGITCTATCEGDSDADSIATSRDNCPSFSNPNQSDTDLDGRGNACECTDQNGDGRNTVSDLVAINTAIFNPSLVTPLCDGNNDGLCNVSDIIACNVEIFSPTNTSTCARQPIPGP